MMNALSVWSSLLLFGYAATATPPPPEAPTPMVVEGRNATTSGAVANVAPSGPRHVHHHVRWHTGR
jgi:hypothetical protein